MKRSVNLRRRPLSIATSILVTMAGLVTFAGCQGWGGGWMNPVRVPPPGTGTYQLPPGYYNNVQPPQTPQPGVGATTSYAPPGIASSSAVQPASYSAAGAATYSGNGASAAGWGTMPPAAAPKANYGNSSGASYSTTPASPPNSPPSSLQWQPPN
ncbi:MAG: hypothetical protein KatS3mg111_3378 [Pirellulaceae bacterium]|nr:MAG: hypothetical protein KatS3mg111_3378 [Pirellulaceae bacterium]